VRSSKPLALDDAAVSELVDAVLAVNVYKGGARDAGKDAWLGGVTIDIARLIAGQKARPPWHRHGGGGGKGGGGAAARLLPRHRPAALRAQHATPPSMLASAQSATRLVSECSRVSRPRVTSTYLLRPLPRVPPCLPLSHPP
jgi:hypothetical protein